MKASSILKSVFFVATLSFVTKASAQHHISNLEAAELALHRIEKLVAIKKIDAGFETKLKNLNLENLKQEKDSDPVFKVYAYQYPAEDKTVMGVQLLQDHMGKVTKYEKIAGGDATGFPEWPDANALTLFEKSMHYVEDNAERVKELMPFEDGLRTISLEPAKDADNKDIALIKISIDTEKDKDEMQLQISLSLDGKTASHQIVKVEKDEK